MNKEDKKEEYYTQWFHLENGKPFTRRLHRIEVQGQDGQLHTITGKNLPKVLSTSCGEGTRGNHLAQILLRPKKKPRRIYLAPCTHAWPSLRDLVSMGMGFMAFVMFKFIASLIADCF